MTPVDFVSNARAIWAHRFIASTPSSRRWLVVRSWGGVWNRVEPKRYIRHELSFYSVVGSKLVVGEGMTKLLCPQADRLVRDNDPRTGQHGLDHPQAQKQSGKKATPRAQ